jgi:hypothetical protein
MAAWNVGLRIVYVLVLQRGNFKHFEGFMKSCITILYANSCIFHNAFLFNFVDNFQIDTTIVNMVIDKA